MLRNLVGRNRLVTPDQRDKRAFGIRELARPFHSRSHLYACAVDPQFGPKRGN
jgi:hypothetical protein